MYEAVLENRRVAMRPLLDLHPTQELVKEWHTLISELDATMRLSGQYVTLLRRHHGRRAPPPPHPTRHDTLNATINTNANANANANASPPK